MRVLFICRIADYNFQEACNDPRKVSGLRNSASFCIQTLIEYGIDAKLVVVPDNNSIDKEVTTYKPDIVILEALWCVPDKFNVLFPLHPNVKWIIRIHSELPFMAMEGISMQWIVDYLDYKDVYVSGNSRRLMRDLTSVVSMSDVSAAKLVFLPNCYPCLERAKNPLIMKNPNDFHVGCFGAIRPLKNQLTQAIAAIQYADTMKYTLHFHMNGDRIEQGGAPIKKNITSLFANTKHKLVFHPWTVHDEFLNLVASMDLCLQVSFSESFNIVTADAVSNDIPVVTSKEVYWLPSIDYANPNDAQNIANRIWHIMNFKWIATRLNYYYLEKHHKNAATFWVSNLQNLGKPTTN